MYEHFESGVLVSHSPPALLVVRLIGFQNQSLWGSFTWCSSPGWGFRRRSHAPLLVRGLHVVVPLLLWVLTKSHLCPSYQHDVWSFLFVLCCRKSALLVFRLFSETCSLCNCGFDVSMRRC